MSIQSTTTLTREEAKARLLTKRMEGYETRERLSIESMSNEEIEDALESTFDNYMIVEEEEYGF